MLVVAVSISDFFKESTMDKFPESVVKESGTVAPAVLEKAFV